MDSDPELLAEEQTERAAFPVNEREIVLLLAALNLACGALPNLQPELRAQAKSMLWLGHVAFRVDPRTLHLASLELIRRCAWPQPILLAASSN